MEKFVHQMLLALDQYKNEIDKAMSHGWNIITLKLYTTSVNISWYGAKK